MHRLWELQERLEDVAAKGRQLEQRLDKIRSDYGSGSISLLQYNQMVEQTLADNVFERLAQEEHACREEIRILQQRMDAVDSYTVHGLNQRRLNMLFIGTLLALFLGLLLGISHPTAYVILP